MTPLDERRRAFQPPICRIQMTPGRLSGKFENGQGTGHLVPTSVMTLKKDRRIYIVAAAIASILADQRLAAEQATKPLFRVQRSADRWWLTSPEGRHFFSMGVCVLDQGTAQHLYNEARPAYGAWKHYKTPDHWADSSLKRLKDWRFTTIGGWSDLATLGASREQTLYLTPVLHLGSTVGAPWLDMWDEKNLARMERFAIEKIDPLRDDPRVIGYYSDNELGWWCATLWQMTLDQPATSGQRQRLVRLVRERYGDDWQALLADFEPTGAANWDELARGGTLAHRSGSGGVRTMRKFLAAMADRYYQLMRDTIRKHDPDALYLGDRYQSFYYPEVARTSVRYIDVASTNLNASWNDGQFLRCYLDTLHKLTGKPVLVSEFYMAAVDNRSGNPNASSGFPVVETQPERAAAAHRTLQALVSLPYVVGADWFQYYDEPPHGRGDGEDYNFGLVDIHDRPYEEVTALFSEFDANDSKSRAAASRTDARSGVPLAPPDPLARFEFMTALKVWDRERSFVPSESPYPLGDLYLCWSPKAIHVGLYALDPVEKALYRDGRVPEADRAVWSVLVNDAEPIAARIGGGEKASVSDARVEVACLSGFDHDLRLIAVMSLPASHFGKRQFAPGDVIKLRSDLQTHGRTDRTSWSGDFTLAN
jgi:hypothetical protein